MSANQIFLIVLLVAIILFCLGFAQNKIAFLAKLVFRGGFGVVSIFLLNAFFEVIKIPLFLGLNFCSISTISLLGIPGLALLYGIVATKTL